MRQGSVCGTTMIGTIDAAKKNKNKKKNKEQEEQEEQQEQE